jgi:hypothetical protein
MVSSAFWYEIGLVQVVEPRSHLFAEVSGIFDDGQNMLVVFVKV